MVNNIERINNTKFSSKKINICISYGDCDFEENEMNELVFCLQKLMQKNSNINFNIITIETGQNEFVKGNKYGVSFHSLQHLCNVDVFIIPNSHHKIVKDYVNFAFFNTISQSPNGKLLFISEYQNIDDVVDKVINYYNTSQQTFEEKKVPVDEIKVINLKEGEIDFLGTFQVRNVVKEVRKFLEENNPDFTIDKVLYQGFEVYPNEFFWHYYVKNPKIILKKKIKISEINAGFVIY